LFKKFYKYHYIFPHPGSAVLNVTIYPSDFGLERMKEEEVLGPKELIEMKYDGDGDEVIVENGDDDVDEYHREKLRQYQLNRLKYYYAVAECDSAETAAKVYEECDGQEFESSAARYSICLLNILSENGCILTFLIFSGWISVIFRMT